MGYTWVDHHQYDTVKAVRLYFQDLPDDFYATYMMVIISSANTNYPGLSSMEEKWDRYYSAEIWRCAGESLPSYGVVREIMDPPQTHLTKGKFLRTALEEGTFTPENKYKLLSKIDMHTLDIYQKSKCVGQGKWKIKLPGRKETWNIRIQDVDDENFGVPSPEDLFEQKQLSERIYRRKARKRGRKNREKKRKDEGRGQGKDEGRMQRKRKRKETSKPLSKSYWSMAKWGIFGGAAALFWWYC